MQVIRKLSDDKCILNKDIFVSLCQLVGVYY